MNYLELVKAALKGTHQQREREVVVTEGISHCPKCNSQNFVRVEIPTYAVAHNADGKVRFHYGHSRGYGYGRGDSGSYNSSIGSFDCCEDCGQQVWFPDSVTLEVER